VHPSNIRDRAFRAAGTLKFEINVKERNDTDLTSLKTVRFEIPVINNSKIDDIESEVYTGILYYHPLSGESDIPPTTNPPVLDASNPDENIAHITMGAAKYVDENGNDVISSDRKEIKYLAFVSPGYSNRIPINSSELRYVETYYADQEFTNMNSDHGSPSLDKFFWAEFPPSFNDGDPNTEKSIQYWYRTYTYVETSIDKARGNNVGTFTFGPPTRGIGFNGLVTFTDLENEGSTTINGSNITTGTIDLERLRFSNDSTDEIFYDTTEQKISVGSINIDKLNINENPFLIPRAKTFIAGVESVVNGTNDIAVVYPPRIDDSFNSASQLKIVQGFSSKQKAIEASRDNSNREELFVEFDWTKELDFQDNKPGIFVFASGGFLGSIFPGKALCRLGLKVRHYSGDPSSGASQLSSDSFNSHHVAVGSIEPNGTLMLSGGIPITGVPSSANYTRVYLTSGVFTNVENEAEDQTNVELFEVVNPNTYIPGGTGYGGTTVHSNVVEATDSSGYFAETDVEQILFAGGIFTSNRSSFNPYYLFTVGYPWPVGSSTIYTDQGAEPMVNADQWGLPIREGSILDLNILTEWKNIVNENKSVVATKYPIGSSTPYGFNLADIVEYQQYIYSEEALYANIPTYTNGVINRDQANDLANFFGATIEDLVNDNKLSPVITNNQSSAAQTGETVTKIYQGRNTLMAIAIKSAEFANSVFTATTEQETATEEEIKSVTEDLNLPSSSEGRLTTGGLPP